MKIQPWRPRFSLRTLAIVVTLVCAYVGAWEATKKWGVAPEAKLLSEIEAANGPLRAAITAPIESSPMPFVVQRTVFGYFHGNQHFYLWLLGPRIKLPLESKLVSFQD